MKIKDHLSNTMHLVTANYRAHLQNFRRSNANANLFYTFILDFERQESWLKLHELFASAELEATPENLQPFVDFLKDRWRRIERIYELTYYRAREEILTETCVSLAKELQLGHWLELLMPTVNFTNDNIVDIHGKGTSISALDAQTEEVHVKQSYMKAGADIGKMIDEAEILVAVSRDLTPEQARKAHQAGFEAAEAEKMQLHHFIVDSEKRMIHVFDCLADAYLDGRLKHTNKFFAHKKDSLNLDSTNRVIYHSQEAQQLYAAVLKFWEKRKHSYSIGGYLNRLVEALKENGESAAVFTNAPMDIDTATDTKPGWKLRIAIAEFYAFTKILTADELEYLYRLKAATEPEYRSFKYYWFRLLQGFAFILDDNKEVQITSQVNDKGDVDINIIPNPERFELKIHEINEFLEYCKQVEQNEIEVMAVESLRASINNPMDEIILIVQEVMRASNEAEAQGIQRMDIDDTSSESSVDLTNSQESEANPLEIVHEWDAPNQDTPCVEIISDHFEGFLQNNFELYYKVPACYAGIEEDSLLEAKTDYEIARENFRQKLKDNTLNPAGFEKIGEHIVYPWHGLHNKSYKLPGLFIALVNNPQSLVRFMTTYPKACYEWAIPLFIKLKLNNCVNSIDGLIYAMNHLSHNQKHYLVKTLKEFHDNQYFRTICNSFDALNSLMEAQPTMQLPFLKKLGAIHLRYIVDTKEGLDKLKELLPFVTYRHLTHVLLGDKHVNRLRTASAKARRLAEEAKSQPTGLIASAVNAVSSVFGFFRPEQNKKKRAFDFEVKTDSDCESAQTTPKKLKTEESGIEEEKQSSTVEPSPVRRNIFG